jgi:hypothetical protein
LAGGQGYVRAVVKADLNADGDTSDAGETVRTDVQGWMDRTIRAACETISFPFEDCPVVAGKVAASTANGIDITGSLGTSTLGIELDDDGCYYLEITSGAYEGHRFDIDPMASLFSAAAVNLTSNSNTMSTIPALTGANFVIRAYKRLGEMFPVSQYGAGTSVSNSDYILVWGPTGWTTYYLLNPAAPRWVRAGAGTLDQGEVCLDPCAGMFVHRRSPASGATFLGHVRENKFACPLDAACSLLANPYPVAASVVDRGLVNPSTASATPFTGATALTNADQILIWDGDSTLGAGTYTVDFYVRNATRNHYTTVGNSQVPNINTSPIFKPLRSVNVCPKVAHEDYVMPLPWIP